MNNNKRQQAVSRLKPLCNNKRQWDALLEYLECHIDEHRVSLEQSEDVVKVHRAQGAIAALRKLKYLRDEANG
jgi:hypothetical protein